MEKLRQKMEGKNALKMPEIIADFLCRVEADDEGKSSKTQGREV